MKPTLHRWRWLAVLFALLLVAAACGDSGETTTTTAPPTPTTDAPPGSTVPPTTPPETTPPETTPPPTEPPVEEQGGTLRMVLGNEPTTLNPMTGVRSDQIVSISMVERLVSTDSNVKVSKSGIVSDWEQTDPTTWRFTVRDGVSFSNGEPADAAAAVFSLETHRDTEGSVLKGFFAVFESATVVEPQVFEVKTTIPTNAVPELLANLYLFPPVYYAEVGDVGFGEAPIGTGPFVFKEWVPGQRISAERYDDHWRGQAGLDGIDWTFAADDAGRVALLQSGDGDIAINVPVLLQDDVESAGDLRMERVAALSNMTIFVVATKPPFDNVDLRVAAAKAMDRNLLVEAIFAGTGASANKSYFHTFFPSVTNNPPGYDYDLEGAQAIVAAQAEQPEITYSYTTGRYPSDGDVGEAVSGMLEAAGFKVNRNPLDAGTFFGQAIGNELDGMFMFATVPVYPHEDVLVRAFQTSNAITKTCPDDRFDPLADAGLAATDQETRNSTYQEIARLGSEELACWIILYEQVLGYGISDRVQNFTPARDDLHDYFPITIVP